MVEIFCLIENQRSSLICHSEPLNVGNVDDKKFHAIIRPTVKFRRSYRLEVLVQLKKSNSKVAESYHRKDAYCIIIYQQRDAYDKKCSHHGTDR